ncbi:Repressor splicing factor 1 [Carabus blaptoides fortunei]
MGDSNYTKGTRVYVGGLGDGIKKEDLETEFEKYGKLNSVWVAFNPPGFAFIEFLNKDEAESAFVTGAVVNGVSVGDAAAVASAAGVVAVEVSGVEIVGTGVVAAAVVAGDVAPGWQLAVILPNSSSTHLTEFDLNPTHARCSSGVAGSVLLFYKQIVDIRTF